MKSTDKLNSALGEMYIINLNLYNAVWSCNNKNGDCMSTIERVCICLIYTLFIYYFYYYLLFFTFII